MKRIAFVISLTMAAVASAAAQTLVRCDLHEDARGRITTDAVAGTVAVQLQVEERTFTPGIYARYAQKYLGVRASLAPRAEAVIVSASLSLTGDAPLSVTAEQQVAAPAQVPTLPANRTDARVLTEEEQAAATAEMIFSLRKHRTELITGEMGENVFGAGLSAALQRIDEAEAEYLAMFYGKTSVSRSSHSFTVKPSAAERNYPLCRFRSDEGIVDLADLAGEAVMLRIDPAAAPDLSTLPQVDPKNRNGIDCIATNMSGCTLLCGTRQIVSASLPLVQYGQRVRIALH